MVVLMLTGLMVTAAAAGLVRQLHRERPSAVAGWFLAVYGAGGQPVLMDGGLDRIGTPRRTTVARSVARRTMAALWADLVSGLRQDAASGPNVG
jgi:hypothetical protein